MKNMPLVIEKSDGHFWGWVESKDNFMPTGQGETIDKLKENIKESIADYLTHEGKGDKYWTKLDLDSVVFDTKYNLESFFDEFDFIDMSILATKSGISRTLLQQYKTGEKNATELQAKRIEGAIHQLAIPMVNFKLVA